jgi:hypothetical protein
MHIVRFADTSWELGAKGTRFKLMNEPAHGARESFEMTVRAYDSNAHRVRRHRHKVEQVRYVLRGDAGPNDGMSSPPGTINYIPASTFYGPYDRLGDVEYLEMRFGGTEDADRPFPKQRFSTPVVIHPENFDATQTGGGAAIKELATFTERRTAIRMIELSRDGSHDLVADNTNFLFVTAGTGSVNGEHLAARDGVTVSASDVVVLTTSDHLQILAVRLPTVP